MDEDQNEKDQMLADYLQSQQPSIEMPEQAVVVKTPAPSLDLASIGADPALKDKAIQDHLTQLFAKDNAAVQQARDSSKRTDFISNIGDALESFAKANSMARGGAGTDTGFYQGLKQQGQQSVQNAVSAKQNDVQGFLQNHELERQMVQDKMNQGDFQTRQAAAQIAAAKNQGDSPVSQKAVASARGTFKDIPGINDIITDGMSANEVAEALKGIEKKATLDNTKQLKNMQLAYQNNNLQDKRDLKQDQVYSELSNKLTNPRGNTAVQQAMVGVNSGKKAMDLIDQYPDLNKMPSQQVALLAQEISKVASGGVGSEHGQRSLEANTMQSNWNKFVSNVSGEPTGAELKGFIEQNKAYLQNMMATNQETINDYQHQVYNGYKKRLTPDQDNLFKTDNPHLFQEKKEAKATVPMPAQSGARSTQGASMAPAAPAATHPEAQQALEWAKANPADPRAKEIIKRLGVMDAGL